MCKNLLPPGINNVEKVQVKGVDTAWTVWGQCEDNDDRGHLQWGHEEAGDKWTQYCTILGTGAGAGAPVQCRGSHSHSHLHNSLLSREHQVIMDIKEGIADFLLLSRSRGRGTGEGRWSPSAVFHRSIVWEQLTTSNEDSATKELH